VWIVAASLVVLLGSVAPLTYDEAFNRVHYDTVAVYRILTFYDLPNNHLPFTVLQALIRRGCSRGTRGRSESSAS
jgi:hypothetical protein